jgi:hypothetical protein
MEINEKLIIPKFINTIDDSMMLTYPIFISQLEDLIDLFNQSEEFLNSFLYKFENIISFIQMQINWRLAITFLEKIVKVIILMENFVFTTRLYIVVMKFLYDQNSVLPLKNVSMKTLAHCLFFCKKSEKDNIIRYLEKEIIDSKNYYKRRLYFPFFQEAISLHSISSLMQYQIFDHILKFLNDNKLMQAKVILNLKDFYPLVFTDNRIKFLINSKIDNLKKMGNVDYEIIKVLQMFYIIIFIICIFLYIFYL